MSTEKLMKPRWKVIANFPSYIDHELKIGDIVTAFNVDGFWCIDMGGDWWEMPEQYPAIFEKLKWWENRKEEDLPKYVKVTKKSDRGILIGKVYLLSDAELTKFYTINFFRPRINKQYAYYEVFHWPELEPATKEEYEAFQKSILSRVEK